MSYGNISAQISDETVNQVITLVQEIDKLLPFTINLSPDDMRALVTMGDKSIPFVDKSLELAKQNPEFVPKFMDVEEFTNDFDLTKQMRKIINVMMPLTEKIRDTFYAVGSEAFFQARVFYGSTKTAAKADVPGTDDIVKELGKRYKPLGKKNNQNEVEEQNQ